jgi:SAM-dependent methyltransferase
VSSDYRSANRASWDERAPAHARSPDYAVERFIEDPSFISGVVSFDAPLLGDIAGLRGVHLQCHIGTDTVSLARLGAHMTGLDFSPAALHEARRLAAATGADVDFVEAEVYDAVRVLGEERFDLLYTGVGAICWLPDIGRWAEVVERLLAPGGRFFMREGHPMLWTLEDGRSDSLLVAKYPYHRQQGALVFEDDTTYVQTDTAFSHNSHHVWNHGLGEIISALLGRGLRVTGLVEHDSVPWEALPGQMQELPGREFRIAEEPSRVPHSYTLQAVKEP